jgi:GrpB-like predicted nucleotidyltransferase (UPF0157 family)
VIQVDDYDTGWADVFARLREDYEAAMSAAGLELVGIEHVGSTAVPGLAAKPVIDIDVVVAEEDVEAASAVMVGLGFEPRGEQGIPQRWAFRAPAHLPITHTYVVVDGSLGLRNHLAVRDVLRANAELRDEYAAVKRAAAMSATDMDDYVGAKNAMVQRILAEAGLTSDERSIIEKQQGLG